MSHGINKGICGIDGKIFETNRLHKMFDAHSCPQLKGKPKLFFIQACRTQAGKSPSFRHALQLVCECGKDLAISGVKARFLNIIP